MIIELSDEWRIRTDSHQWIVEKRRRARAKYNAKGYFRTLGSALDRASARSRSPAVRPEGLG